MSSNDKLEIFMFGSLLFLIYIKIAIVAIVLPSL